MSTLGNARIHTCDLHVPRFGGWRADVVLDGGDAPALGPATLTIGTLALRGTVIRAAEDAPDRPHAVLFGGAGWDRALATTSYQLDAGVHVRSVVAELARQAGEPVELPPDGIVGSAFAVDPAGPHRVVRLRDVLGALQREKVIPPWRVDPDGVTRFGARTGTTSTARTTVMRRDIGAGMLTIGLDDPATFLPGNSINDNGTVVPIGILVVRDRPNRMEADVYRVAAPSILDPIMRRVAEVWPAVVYGYPRTYIVNKAYTDGRLDLEPPPDSPLLAELPLVPPGFPPGYLAVPPVGARVLVDFADAMPSRPSWRPLDQGYDGTIELAGGGAAAARKGDAAGRLIYDSVTQTVYYSPGTLLAPLPYVPLAPNLNSPLPPDPTTLGTPLVIASGSSDVEIG